MSLFRRTFIAVRQQQHNGFDTHGGREIMSARQAKRLGKLTGKQDAEELRAENSSEDELEEKRPASMGFAFLQDSDSDEDSERSDESGGDDQGNDDDDVSDERKEEEAEVEPEVKPAAAPSSNATKQSAKKKKKSKGKKDGQGGRGDELPDGDNVDDILDTLVAQAGGMHAGQAGSGHGQQENSLFSVQLNFVNADKEMKRIFGVREVREGSSTRRTDPRNVARKTTKKVFTVTPHDDWPRPPTFVGGGIRWTRANKPEGPAWNTLANYFEISWSMSYKKAQEEFEVLQQTHDPNLIAHFLQRHPFHLDALLQMSEVHQHHGQMDHASDCIKRCMYVLELAWADQFDVTKGNCRMDFYTEHNDAFFKALFLLMKQVGRRGCMRSAFETAKLLLGLDPQGDPMNVLLAIDYYAVTARQCQFIVDLCSSKLQAVERSKGVSSKPSKSSSKSTNTSAADADNTSLLPNLQLSLSLAQYFLGKEDEAKNTLACALLRFPTVLKPLLDKIGASMSSAAWQSVLGSRVFANAKSLNENSALQHVLDIYVNRNFSVWKVNDVQNFLLRGAQLAVSSPGLLAANPQLMELPPSLLKYKRSYPGDYSDDVTTLPPDHPMMRPPPPPGVEEMAAQLANIDLNDLNPEQLAQLQQLQQQAEAGNLPADANPLLLFLQTLLPWNHVQGVARPQPPPPHPE